MWTRCVVAVLIGAGTCAGSSPHSRAQAPCVSDADCSLLGACVLNATTKARACVCDEGFTGATCGMLDLLPSQPSWGFVDASHPSYGGSVALSSDGVYHMFASSLDVRSGCAHADGLNSAVVHAIAAQLQGPYRYKDVALPAFHDAAAVAVAGAASAALLFADSKTVSNDDVMLACSSNASRRLQWQPRRALYSAGFDPRQQQIQVFTSTSSDFNSWTPARRVVGTELTAGPLCNRTNPSAMLVSADEALVAVSTGFCQSRDGTFPSCGRKTNNGVCRHVALFSASGLAGGGGALSVSATAVVDALEGTDEPFLFATKRGLHILAHEQRRSVCGSGGGPSCGVLASRAVNTTTWRKSADLAFTSRLQWASGAAEMLRERRRPKILFSAAGTPLLLVCAVQRANGTFPHTLVFPFNVAANARLGAGAGGGVDGGSAVDTTPNNGASPNAARALVLMLVASSLLFVLVRVRRKCRSEVGGDEGERDWLGGQPTSLPRRQ